VPVPVLVRDVRFHHRWALPQVPVLVLVLVLVPVLVLVLALLPNPRSPVCDTPP
jgi:hypothetical protein